MGALASLPARQPQQPFAGAVGGNLLGHHFGAVDREMLGELRPQLLGDAGHLREIGGAADIDPVPQLLRPHLALRGRHADAAEALHQLGRDSPISDGLASAT